MPIWALAAGIVSAVSVTSGASHSARAAVANASPAATSNPR
jgi:hypothetical protein